MSQANTPDVRDLILSQDRVKQDVGDFLAKYFADNVTHSDQLDEQYGDLWRAMESLAMVGGKRLRPYFLVLTYLAYGGADYEQVLPVAAAQELLHVSLLIHDDIIDKDYVRYGQDNVAGLMKKSYSKRGAGRNAEHFGNSAAILAGDLLLSGAYQLIASSQLNDAQKAQATAKLGESIFLVGGGELLDTESSLLAWGSGKALKIADLKTARYSFVGPMVTGALLANAGKPDVGLIEEMGIALGIAFQLADDLLGIYGDSKVTGKTTVGDIREGKRTYLMEQAIARANKADLAKLQKLLGNPKVTQTQAKQVQAILERCGAKADCLAQIELYAAQATSMLECLAMSDAAKDAFRQIIQKATKRVK